MSLFCHDSSVHSNFLFSLFWLVDKWNRWNLKTFYDFQILEFFSKKISFGKKLWSEKVRSEILSGNWFCFRIRFFREIDKIQIKKRKTWSGLLGSNFKTLKNGDFYGKIMILLTMTHQNLNENDVTMTHHHLKW